MGRFVRHFAFALLSVIVVENLAVLPAYAETSDTPSTQAQAPDREALIWIDHRLRHIESTAREERIVSGVTLLGLGAAAGVGAGIAAGSSDPSWNSTGAVFLGVAGGVFAISGALVLALPRDYEKIPQKFQDIPESSDEQIRAKIVTGESYLTSISNEAKQDRLVGGGTLLAIGAGEIGWYLARQSDPVLQYYKNEYLLYAGIISATLGVVTLLNQTDAEKAASDYEVWKGIHRKNVLSSLKPGFTPVPTGGMATLSLSF